jgi:hypothetical protein
MLFALVVMAGVLLLTMLVNNRRRPSRWERGRAGDGSPSWAYGGDSGSDCGVDAGSGDCGGGDGGGGGGGGGD